jgi:hypothetical protein
VAHSRDSLHVAGDTFPHHDDFNDAGGVWELHEKHWIFRDVESIQKLRSLVPQPPYFLPSRSLGILSTEVPSSVKFLKYTSPAVQLHSLTVFRSGKAAGTAQDAAKVVVEASHLADHVRVLYLRFAGRRLTSCPATASRGANP